MCASRLNPVPEPAYDVPDPAEDKVRVTRQSLDCKADSIIDRLDNIEATLKVLIKALSK